MTTKHPEVDASVRDAIRVLRDFAQDSREKYDDTREWTKLEGSSCMTIRVPTALLARIRDLAEDIGV